jgi:hypothetical protein
VILCSHHLGYYFLIGHGLFDKDVELKEGSESDVLLFMLNTADVNNIEIYQMIIQKLIWSSFEEVEEVVNGIPSIVTYGYPVADFSRSETLFVEKDLPFSFALFSGHKTVLRSKPKLPLKTMICILFWEIRQRKK